MKISLLSEDSIRLEAQAGTLTIEAPDDDTQYSPFHMLGSSLSLCSYAVLASWASNAGLDIADLAIEVSWKFVDEPHRIGEISMELDWPSLPAARIDVARRAAALCAIHATLEHSPAINVEIRQ